MTPPAANANRILIWMCVLIAVNQLGFGSVVPVVPLYAASFGVTTAAIGLAIAVYGLARFLINMPAGRLADQVGRRGTLALGGLITVLGNLLCALAVNYGLFLGGRFVAGAGAALTLTAGQIVLADVTEPAERGRAMGTMSTGQRQRVKLAQALAHDPPSCCSTSRPTGSTLCSGTRCSS